MQALTLALLPSVALGLFTRKPTPSPTVVPTVPSGAPTVNVFDCQTLTPGQEFVNPVNVSSRNGYLGAYLNYRMVDTSNADVYPHDNGAGRYCYMITSGVNEGEKAPVLRAHPGETMLVTLTNDIPKSEDVLFTLAANDYCLARVATTSSTNMHFHGFHSQPVCHDDNVVMTIVNSGDSFTYAVEIPTSQPPGLYWYHPHIHEISDYQVAGGATGVMVIEGIENVQPEVAGLPEQIMVLRMGPYMTLNFIPIYDEESPVSLRMKPLETQFWRIANTMADNEVNLTLSYDGEPQMFRVIALDGVAVGSDQTSEPYDTPVLFIPAGGRAEVIVVGPSADVEEAYFQSVPFVNPNNGDVFYTKSYKILSITTDEDAVSPPALPANIEPGTTPSPLPTGRVPTDLLDMEPAATHTLTFYQEINPPENVFKWFLNVDEEPFQLFNINAAPAIVGTQGTVEDWTIINNTTESHDFHIHQMHFLVTKIDGVDVPAHQMQYLDTLRIPQQEVSTTANEYGLFLTTHSITIRVDFTGDVVGKFVMHCHILFHEDNGMMRIVEVVPNPHSPTPFPTPDPDADTVNDDDSRHAKKGLYIAVGILAGAVAFLIIVLLYYVIIVMGGSSSTAAPSAVTAATPSSAAAAGTHQPVRTSEEEPGLELNAV